MSESVDDKLREVAQAIADLEKKLEDGKKQARQLGLYADFSIVPGARETHEARIQQLEDMEQKLRDARQKQTALLLDSISRSSNRLEAATRNLQQSSEAQVKVAESQAEAINNILKSSRTIEQFSLFLILLTIVNIFIVESVSGLLQGALGIGTAITLLVLIFILMAIAYRWPNRLLRRSRSA